MKGVKRFIVSVDNIWEDEIKLSNGHILYKDVTWKPNEDVRIWGYVTGTCAGYPEVEVGDKIYFNYLTYREHDQILDSENWWVRAEDVFCVIKDGQIKMLNDWCLVNIRDISEDYGPFVNPFKKIDRQVGVIAHLPESHNLHTFDGRLQVGELVIFNSKPGCFENEIEGQKYWTMKTKHILCSIAPTLTE